MNTHRQTARLVGLQFIAATVSAILGFIFYQPILTGDYLMNGAENSPQVALGAMMELILVVTAIGTAIGLFPILRPYGERIALAHLCFRFFEAVLITVGIVSVLSLLTLSEEFVAADAPDASAFHAVGTVLLAIHDWTFMLGPYFMLGINTLMYSYLLYKSNLVPLPLATLGMTGAILVFGGAMLVLFDVAVQGSAVVTLMAMPIAFYEMILAAWLIGKGFKPSAIAGQPAPKVTNQLLSAA